MTTKKFVERGVTFNHVLDLAKEDKHFQTFKIGDHFFYDKIVYQKVEFQNIHYGVTVETGEVVPFEDKDEVTLISGYTFGPEVVSQK